MECESVGHAGTQTPSGFIRSVRIQLVKKVKCRIISDKLWVTRRTGGWNWRRGRRDSRSRRRRLRGRLRLYSRGGLGLRGRLGLHIIEDRQIDLQRAALTSGVCRGRRQHVVAVWVLRGVPLVRHAVVIA